jgi:DNA-binding transcriptional regulator GbsR (MarR family)
MSYSLLCLHRKKSYMNEVINQNQKELVEKAGIIYEKDGLQPAASRILALLMVADNPELTFDEIREALNLSKSATSTAINLLITINRIEYITNPGERKRYFRLKIGNWKENFMDKIEGLVVINTLFKEILNQRPKNTKEFNKSLAEVISFMEFVQKEIPDIIKRWKAKK